MIDLFTHVERESLTKITDGIVVITTWCGEQCLCMPDASLVPEDFDFYLERAAYKADCDPCKRALSKQQTTIDTTVEV